MPDENRTLDITPVLPNSPVVSEVKRFIERIFWYSDRMDQDSEDTRAFRFWLHNNKKRIVRAMGEILADDSVILVQNRLPSDRDRMIGTRRRLDV